MFWLEEFSFVTGENGKIVYSITSGDENGDFGIASNGTIFTKKQLDREAQSLYNLLVTATDKASPPQDTLSSTVQVGWIFLFKISLKRVRNWSSQETTEIVQEIDTFHNGKLLHISCF